MRRGRGVLFTCAAGVFSAGVGFTCICLGPVFFLSFFGGRAGHTTLEGGRGLGWLGSPHFPFLPRRIHTTAGTRVEKEARDTVWVFFSSLSGDSATSKFFLRRHDIRVGACFGRGGDLEFGIWGRLSICSVSFSLRYMCISMVYFDSFGGCVGGRPAPPLDASRAGLGRRSGWGSWVWRDGRVLRTCRCQLTSGSMMVAVVV